MTRLHFLFFLLIISIIVAWLYFTNPLSQLLNNDEIHYEDKNLGISFVYPGLLTVTSKVNEVKLSHKIPFVNFGDCDMIGENKRYNDLIDLEFTFSVQNLDIVKSMKKISTYIPDENFKDGKVVISPGFIDSYNTGRYSGYKIYEGAEGCGHTIYYLKVSPEKTLVVKNKSIQVLSGIASKEEENRALNTPNVINKETNAYYFDFIMKNLEVKA